MRTMQVSTQPNHISAHALKRNSLGVIFVFIYAAENAAPGKPCSLAKSFV
jgi:hypothetical protein